MQPELNNTKIIFLHSAAWTAKCSTCLHVHIFCMNVLFKMSTTFKMSTIRHQHLWGGRKHRSSSLVIFIPLKHFLDQGSARSHQKVTPAGGHFSLTDRFCVGTTTTPSPRHRHATSRTQVSLPLSTAQRKYYSSLSSVHMRTGGKQRGTSG